MASGTRTIAMMTAIFGPIRRLVKSETAQEKANSLVVDGLRGTPLQRRQPAPTGQRFSTEARPMVDESL